jgi:hypothetical protein
MPRPGSLAWASTDQYAQRIAYVPNEDYEEYICETHPKNQHRTSADVWRIRRIQYDATWRVVSITWANRSKDFTFSCDAAATYNYD